LKNEWLCSEILLAVAPYVAAVTGGAAAIGTGNLLGFLGFGSAGVTASKHDGSIGCWCGEYKIIVSVR
jgi:hypothetical protein